MRRNWLWPVLAGMLVGGFCADAQAQDTPGSVTLQWTAPGDDSLSGTASRYDIRYSLFPITEQTFDYLTGPKVLPLPSEPGTVQRVTITGLLPGLRYYFALKTADERNNWSGLSNVVAFAEALVDVGEGGSGFRFDSPVPNPSRVSTQFAYAIPVPVDASLEIFDLQGRMIRRVHSGALGPGTGTLGWDLRRTSGERVEPGVYLARARLAERQYVRRILVTR